MNLLSDEAIKALSTEIATDFMKELKNEIKDQRNHRSEFIKKADAYNFFGVSENTCKEWERLGLKKYKSDKEGRTSFYKISEVYDMITRHKE